MDSLSPLERPSKHTNSMPEADLRHGHEYRAPSITECTSPRWGFDVTGHAEVNAVIFGWLTDIGAQQELMNIVEFGDSVTCFLRITDKESAVLEIVEVFQINAEGHVSEIWAL